VVGMMMMMMMMMMILSLIEINRELWL
jgi:hypothetical protein